MTTPHDNTQKPPPIAVGVSGIQSQAVVNKSDSVDWWHWEKVIGFPPFEMFLREHFGITENYMDAARVVLVQHHNNGTLHQLFDDYCVWHKATGNWKKEDPLGNIIEE